MPLDSALDDGVPLLIMCYRRTPMPSLFSLSLAALLHLDEAANLSVAKLPEAYAIFDPVVNVMPIIPVLFFLLTFVWQAAVSFR